MEVVSHHFGSIQSLRAFLILQLRPFGRKDLLQFRKLVATAASAKISAPATDAPAPKVIPEVILSYFPGRIAISVRNTTRLVRKERLAGLTMYIERTGQTRHFIN